MRANHRMGARAYPAGGAGSTHGCAGEYLHALGSACPRGSRPVSVADACVAIDDLAALAEAAALTAHGRPEL
jgi:hypothetical protein